MYKTDLVLGEAGGEDPHVGDGLLRVGVAELAASLPFGEDPRLVEV